jgi:hypothetical protein
MDNPSSAILKNRSFLRVCLLLAVPAGFLALAVSPARADVYQAAGVSGLWSDTNIWRVGGVKPINPPSADDVLITTNGTYTITQDLGETPISLTVGGASGTQTLVTSHGISADLVTLGTNAVMTITGTPLFLCPVNNQGTINVLSGEPVLGEGMTSSGTINVASGAGIDLSAGTFNFNPGHRFTGSGVWHITDTVTVNGDLSTVTFSVEYDVTFNSRLLNGSMTWNSSGNQYGTLTIASNSVYDLVSGCTLHGTVTNWGQIIIPDNVEWWIGCETTPGSRTNTTPCWLLDIQGNGACRISPPSGNIAVNGLFNGNLTYTVDGDNVFNSRLDAAMWWTNGTLSGTFTLGTNAALTYLDHCWLYGVVTNWGRITWLPGTSGWIWYSGGILENRPGALVDFQTDFRLELGPGMAFNNYGTLRKSGGSGTSTFDSGFIIINQGVVEAQVGTISFGGPYSETTSADLAVSLAGVNPGTQYGTLAFANAPAFHGKFTVGLRNGFLPSLGNSFNVVAFPSSSGNFSAWEGLTLGNGLVLSPQFSATSLTLLTVADTATWTVAATASPSDGGTVTGAGAFPPGATRTVVAAPQNGSIFNNWTENGLAVSTAAAYTFTLTADRNLVANFVRGNFSPVAGTYNGLFYGEVNGVSQQSSGFFTITTTAKWKFTGSLVLGGAHYPLGGTLDTNGFKVVPTRHLGTVLTVALQVDLTPGSDRIEGTVTNGTWTTFMDGERVYNTRLGVAPQKGKYTLVFGGGAGTNEPGGYSCATLSVKGAGTVSLAGTLADGTKISKSSVLCQNRQLPFYVPLYGGAGSLLSWLTFSSTASNDVSGTLNWIKPSVPKAAYYPGPFAFDVLVNGFRYHAPSNGTPVLNFSAGELVLSGADLTQPITNYVVLKANNHVTSTNKAVVTFTLSNGAFKGSVADPNTLKRISFNGVVLQTQNIGCACFLHGGRSGEVLLGTPEDILGAP